MLEVSKKEHWSAGLTGKMATSFKISYSTVKLRNKATEEMTSITPASFHRHFKLRRTPDLHKYTKRKIIKFPKLKTWVDVSI